MLSRRRRFALVLGAAAERLLAQARRVHPVQLLRGGGGGVSLLSVATLGYETVPEALVRAVVDAVWLRDAIVARMDERFAGIELPDEECALLGALREAMNGLFR